MAQEIIVLAVEDLMIEIGEMIEEEEWSGMTGEVKHIGDLEIGEMSGLVTLAAEMIEVVIQTITKEGQVMGTARLDLKNEKRITELMDRRRRKTL